MCRKFIKRQIEKETTIEIRKRQEEMIKYRCGVLLAILFAGGFVAGKNSLSSVWLGAILTVIILALYLFFDNFYLEKYSEYTNHLIREKEKKTKNK